jgi:NAD(P)H-flavin reductase
VGTKPIVLPEALAAIISACIDDAACTTVVALVAAFFVAAFFVGAFFAAAFFVVAFFVVAFFVAAFFVAAFFVAAFFVVAFFVAAFFVAAVDASFLEVTFRAATDEAERAERSVLREALPTVDEGVWEAIRAGLRKRECASKLPTMSDLFALPVVSVADVAERQALLVLDAAGTAVHASHTAAGQHLLLRLFNDDVARPFAIANAPNPSGLLEFLIKLPPERMPRVTSLSTTDRIDASACVGRGFALHEMVGKDLLLCGVGSGIAPLRAALDAIVAQRHDFGSVALLYGVRTSGELCFKERFGAWAGLDVKVVPVVSRPAESGWAGAVGYVQDHVPPLRRPDDTAVLVCGLPDMEKALASALALRGIKAQQLRRNW